MSKTVAIKEGDRAYRFGKCSYLRTNKQGGGYVVWVPEDDRDTTTKHITKDGTYKVSDEKKTGGGSYYGYSEVTVNVPDADKAIGKKPDGNTHVVQPDLNGDLTDKIIPDYIKIISEPYKTEYTDGEAISMSGMVVKAYQGDGSIWEASGYSSGIIPHSELTLTPATAHAGGQSGSYEKDGVRAIAVRCTVPVSGTYWRNYRTASPTGYAQHGAFGKHHEFITLTTEGEVVYLTKYNGWIYVAYSTSPRGTVVIANEDGTGAEGNESLGGYSGDYIFGEREHQEDYAGLNYLPIPESDVDPEGVNFRGAVAEGNAITVSWHRPDDLKELADSFNISVTD